MDVFPQIRPASTSSISRKAERQQRNRVWQVRGILIAVGLVSVGMSLPMILRAEADVKRAVQAESGTLALKGLPVDDQVQARIEEAAKRAVYLKIVMSLTPGIVLTLLGLLAGKNPLACSAGALTLFVAAGAWLATADTALWRERAIIDIVSVAALLKAVHAGAIYQKRAKEARVASDTTAPTR